MAAGFNLRDKGDNLFMGNVADDSSQDFFNIGSTMARSISAPPPGLVENLTSSTPDISKEQDPTTTKEYYDYYYSLKPLDPRLPKPKWKPFYAPPDHMALYHKVIHEGTSESGGSNPENSAGEEFTNQFDTMTLNSTQDSGMSRSQAGHGYFQQGGSKQMGSMQQDNPRTPTQGFGGGSKAQGTWRNQGAMPGSQGMQQQHHQHHHQHQQGGTGGYQSRPQKTFTSGMGGGSQMNQEGYGQGQFYPSQSQPMGNFYGGNYVTSPMPQQGFYGMNQFQGQMYPQYQSDPNMGYNMGGMNNFQNFQYPNMSPMQTVNPMYMNPAPQMGGGAGGAGGMRTPGMMNNMGGGYNPMSPSLQGGFQGGHQHHQGNTQQGNKGQKSLNKPTHPKLDIKQVLANLLENCRDQNGSRLIQQHFEKADENEKESMFQQISSDILGLMTDVFGNYVVQKVLELGTPSQKQNIFEAVKDNIFQVSQNTYGCRVIQKLLEQFKNNALVQDIVLHEISQDVLFLIQDQNGNHVLQKCFETINIDKLQFIVDVVAENVDSLAFHAYGCRVIQKILETAPNHKISPMLRKLMDDISGCCQNQFGNYIMQHVLEKGPNQEKELLMEALKKNFVKLSMNKFASNVTEKSANYGPLDFRNDAINVLLNSHYDNKIGLVALMTNPYGNYVVQRLFERSDDRMKRRIYDKVRQENVEEIKKNSYGRHVMTFIEKWMEGQQS